MSAIAATIAMVLVHQTVLLARAEGVRSTYDSAYRAALSVKLDFERQLAADPRFFTKVLYRYERPRLCTRNGTTTAVIPPQDPTSATGPDVTWPTDCPQTWAYLPSGQSASSTDAGGTTTSWDASQHPVRLELTPPSATSPNLTIRVLAANGPSETGLTATYRLSSATSITAFSQTDMHLDNVFYDNPGSSGSGANVTVRGTLYSAGTTFLPTATADVTGAQLFSEGGFIGPVPAGGRLFATTANGAGQGGIHDIRTVVPAPLDINGLRSSYGRLETAGCPPGASAVNQSVPGAGTVPDSTFSSLLCLRHGQHLISASGAALTDQTSNPAAPAPAAYLLMFSGASDAPTVKVYVSATPPATVGACVIRCDLLTLAQPDYAAGLSPASPAGTGLWQLLGEFAQPASGVIVTDADTYVGQCSRSLGGPSAPACSTTVAQRSVTVVAGSARDPHDIILSGPSAPAPAQNGVPAAALGLVATRSVVVPYYARTAGGDESVRANVVALGFGLRTGMSALRTLPDRQAPADQVPAGNYGGTFTLTGSLAAPSLTAALPGWAHVRLAADPASVTLPPPLFPGFVDGWQQQALSRLSSYDVCGADVCAGSW